jgi:protoheme IX farnesyltransferase
MCKIKEKIMKLLLTKARLYWPLIKSMQTGLLLATGLAGYMSARCPITHWIALTNLAGSLFLAISGSTALNMWYDRDIDSRMERTHNRPLASSKVSPAEVLWMGLLLSMLGVGWAVLMKPLYGLVVFAGLFFDVVVYTLWLKRRTCWSIVWGGLSGGMPILAGRVLGTGGFDWIGIILCLSVLFWIPTHIMTFSMKYQRDYQAAGIPTFPSAYNFEVTRRIIAVSNVMAALSIGAAALGIGMAWGYLWLIILLSAGLIMLTARSLIKPSERANFSLFKYASVYMLGSMLLVIVSGV